MSVTRGARAPPSRYGAGPGDEILPVPPDAPPRRARVSPPVAVAVAWVAAAVLLARQPTAISDDAWISFRYAWNLVHGHGLTWNEHMAPVEGYSNLSWTLLMAGGIALGAPVAAWAKGWGVAFAAGAAVAAGGCVRQVGGGRLAAAIAVLLSAASAVSSSWAVAGLEGPLLGFLLTVGTWRALAEDRAVRDGARAAPWSLALFGLASITHVEGPLYLGIPVLVRLARVRVDPLGRRDLVHLALLCAPAAGQLALRLAYYGDHLPNTMRAKGLGDSDPARVLGLRYLLAGLSYDRFQATLWIVGGVAALWAGRAAILLPAVCTAIFVLVADGDDFGWFRFLVPGVPALVATSVAGLDAVVARLRGGALGAVAAVGAGLLVAGTLVGELRPQTLRLAQNPHTVRPQLARQQQTGVTLDGTLALLAPPWAMVDAREWSSLWTGFTMKSANDVPWFLSWLVENLPPDAAFYFEDVGLVGYTMAGNDLLDGRGLNWRASAEVRTPRVGESPEVVRFREEFFTASPAAIFLSCDDGLRFPDSLMAVLYDERFRSQYRYVARGPYFATAKVCLFAKSTVERLPRATIVRRYERLIRELPGARDWERRLADVRAGLDFPSELPYANQALPQALR